jgi:hypothetical protein
VAGGKIAIRLDPIGMLDAQGVVDLLLELGVRVDFVRQGKKCAAIRN